MKKKLLPLTTILLSVVFLATCDGGKGGGSSKKLGTNKYLGNLPALAYYYEMMDSISSAEYDAQVEKHGDKLSNKKAIKISKKLVTHRKENKKIWKEGIIKEKKELIGKDVPFEVKVSNYEISDLKISEVSEYAVVTTGTVTVMEEMPAEYFFSKRGLQLYYLLLNKNNEVMNKFWAEAPVDDNKRKSALPGEKYEMRLTISFFRKCVEYVDFAKVVFISKEEYDTEI